MPIWAFVPIILVALVACPLSMWVMGKLMRRQASCPICRVDPAGEHRHSLQDLEAQRASLDQEIAQVKTKVEQDARREHAGARADQG